MSAHRAGPPRWYLLIHQLPPKPLYLRAKIRQQLAKVGAVALKNSVYILPRTPDCLEDFQWIAQEALAGGGEAYVCESEFLGGATEKELVRRFREARDADSAELARELRRASPPEVARARRRLEEIRAIDFFESPGLAKVRRLLSALENRAPGARKGGSMSRSPRPPSLTGKTWVTRRGVKVDRMASAWLIRRFVDPAARFRFVDPERARPRSGEIRFDMVGGDFTHEADRCTFETLLARLGLDDPALRPMAEIVHDVDLKDEKFSRGEARGLQQLIQGLVAAHSKDEERLERGLALFDDLYASFRGRQPPSRNARAGRRAASRPAR